MFFDSSLPAKMKCRLHIVRARSVYAAVNSTARLFKLDASDYQPGTRIPRSGAWASLVTMDSKVYP